MIRPIVRDVMFLSARSDPATPADAGVARDLEDTLNAHSDTCAGLAANMIGHRKRVIIAATGFGSLVMYNPVITKKIDPYPAEEGCLSLAGTRTTTRYREIEVEFQDRTWKRRRQTYTGWIAQIIQHEVDHLEGIII